MPFLLFGRQCKRHCVYMICTTPWSSSRNEPIQNGISFTPPLHRAFDRKLIGINAEYRVVVSDMFVENKDSPFNLKQFHGRKIILPNREAWWPDRAALAERGIS